MRIYINRQNLEKIQLDCTIEVQFCIIYLKLFIFREFYFLILELNVEHIINIHPNELLSTKTKEYRINEL